jgi:hypothetical protein
VTAAGAVTVLGSFTPLHALLGGLFIGLAAIAQLVLLGRVLGVSGAVKGIVTRQPHAWRYAFVAGMLLASVPLAIFVPSAFQSLPESYSVRLPLFYPFDTPWNHQELFSELLLHSPWPLSAPLRSLAGLLLEGRWLVSDPPWATAAHRAMQSVALPGSPSALWPTQ